MENKKLREVHLQEYLETIATAHGEATTEAKAKALLKSHAELQYQLKGGGKCPMCRASVRHVIPVRTMHKDDGSWHRYHCLCGRCFEGERGLSNIIIMQIGDARVEYKSADYDGAGEQRTRRRAAKAGE
jgi:hypothetical protein